MIRIPTDIHIRILWGNLSSDPASPGFLDQKVAVSTDECPDGSRVRDNRWIFPADICTKHGLRYRVIDFDIPIGKASLLDPQFADLLLWAKRHMIAVLARPSRGMLHLASVRGEFFFVKALVKFVATNRRGNGDASLASMTQKQANNFARTMSADWKADNSFLKFEIFIRRIQKFGADGLNGDQFSLEAFRAIMLACKNNLSATKHWSIVNAAEKAAEDDIIPYPPLPDEYCRQALAIARFYRDVLAVHLIKHARKYMELYKKNEHAGYSDWAKSYRWPVSELPFTADYQFPPTNWRHTSLLITLMQTANAHEVLLFTGARNCEFLMMNQKCLASEEDDAGIIHSIRFKNTPSLAGAKVGWPVPQCVVDAVKTQIELAKAVGSSSGVWLSPRTLVRPLCDNLVSMLQRFAVFHQLDPAVGEAKTVNVQRFRPTIARLVYLAEGADVRLVKRVLGHRWVTTTIAYLKMSPYIQEELNLNRYATGEDPPTKPGPTCAEMDLTPKSLSALLLALKHQGRRLHAIGPGVFVTTDVGAHNEEIIPIDATEALSFVVDWMTKAPARRDDRVYEWLTGEANRIASTAEVHYRPPTGRHHIAYDSIMKGVSRVEAA
ncbi:MAG: site-specific integrase [Xanthobacteraceae bacterium]|nr:site-specific integrase [Xanthobacteraceae bacterium]